MNLQEQIKQTKAKLAKLEAQQLFAELQAQQQPGTIVWAWYDGCDERYARLTILKKVNGPKSYTCQFNQSGGTECYDNIKPITLPPSKSDLERAFYAGMDHNGPGCEEWINENFPEAI